ncbi:hypothetical protein Pint_05068 [Pistacia integerrima]|uniref:Uncharacterized protein n=1 Tax=Pistacia integerrima TaxID=434235 RepID=A0ACC0Z7P2_9ROSI|nr:hypothetical protein Pint_05068 [Pistacia integerrima]
MCKDGKLIDIDRKRFEAWKNMSMEVPPPQVELVSRVIGDHFARFMGHLTGDDLDEDMVANYAANLEKVLSELPSPVNSGTMLTVEDLQQELELDEMVLSGWTQALAVVGNSGSRSNALRAEAVEAEKETEVDEISEPSGRNVINKTG